MAIAHAVLRSMVDSLYCKTLFITHYPLVATDLEREFRNEVHNVHMGYEERTRIDGSQEITFLYRLTNGLAPGTSYDCSQTRLGPIPRILWH
jgi:DNA mismatch repair protein MSH3